MKEQFCISLPEEIRRELKIRAAHGQAKNQSAMIATALKQYFDRNPLNMPENGSGVFNTAPGAM